MSNPEMEPNNMRALGLTWQPLMVAVYPVIPSNDPPALEESWTSLKEYLEYYLLRGKRF